MLLGSGHIGARTATSLDDWAPLTQERPSPSLDALPALAGQSPANLVSYNPGGQPNGPARGPFTSWFRYPAGFSAQTLETCLDSVRVTRGSRVLDPFAGVATAGCAVVARGGEFIGIEAHPLIAEVAALKFACPREPAGLLAAGIAVLARDCYLQHMMFLFDLWDPRAGASGFSAKIVAFCSNSFRGSLKHRIRCEALDL